MLQEQVAGILDAMQLANPNLYEIINTGSADPADTVRLRELIQGQVPPHGTDAYNAFKKVRDLCPFF